MSWTPRDEIVQRDTNLTTVNAILGARTVLGNGSASATRLLPGVPELSNSDAPCMANGNI